MVICERDVISKYEVNNNLSFSGDFIYRRKKKLPTFLLKSFASVDLESVIARLSSSFPKNTVVTLSPIESAKLNLDSQP